MISISKESAEAIRSRYPSGETLRLGISPRGCGAPEVTLTPCAGPLEGETALEADGLTFVIDTGLYAQTGGIGLEVVTGRTPRYRVRLENPLRVSGCGQCPASPMQGGACGIIEGRNF